MPTMAVLKPTCQFDVSLSIQQYAARVCVCVCVWCTRVTVHVVYVATYTVITVIL